MSAWGSVQSVEPGILSPWDELRMILSEHCHPPAQKERGLQLLELLIQEERRRTASGDLHPGGMASQGFAVRPNGDITGPGNTSAFGDNGLNSNGVLWGGGGPGAGWGKSVGLGGIGTWGGNGLGTVPGGSGWGFPGGNKIASGVSGGLAMDDEASAVLSGLALDGPPGQGLMTTGAPNPVFSFDLDPTPVQDSRLGFFMGNGPSVVNQAAAAPAAPAKQQQALAPNQAPVAPPVQQPPKAEQQQQQPQGNTAAKFSSVVGGTASGRQQVSSAAPVAPADDPKSKSSGNRGPQSKTPSHKVEAKRPEPKRIDAANSVASKGGATSKVKLRGLPYGATTSDVVNFFRGFGVVESAVQFGFNSDGRPSGEAWISFSRLEDARRAVREKDRHHMGDRYVELFLLNEGGGVASRGYK